MLTAAVALSAASVLSVWLFERSRSGASIHGFLDVIWWALVTVSTVGYGDAMPESTGGKIAAMVLMLVGVAAFGLVTAWLASRFVGEEEEQLDGELRDQLNEMAVRLERIEVALSQLSPTPDDRECDAAAPTDDLRG